MQVPEDHARISGNGMTIDAWFYHGTVTVAYPEFEQVQDGMVMTSAVTIDTSLLDEI